jgi:5'(3')-deoxyribonucleotidase
MMKEATFSTNDGDGMKQTTRANLVAQIDLDGTLANYNKAILEGLERLRGPDEDIFLPNFGEEPEHIKNRLRAIRDKPGWWRELEPIPLGFKVLDILRKYGFNLNILTKGPWSNSASWTEKVDWCRKYVPDAAITITENKSNVYGKILMDDYIPYVEGWLEFRPRGLVIMPALPWNEGFEHPNVIRLTENNLHDVEIRVVEVVEKAVAAAQGV